jgi:hypothetical protein
MLMSGSKLREQLGESGVICAAVLPVGRCP